MSTRIKGVDSKANFFLFGLSGLDIVLGLKWLASFGQIKENFDTLTFQLKIDAEKKLFKAELELIKSAVSLKAISMDSR